MNKNTELQTTHILQQIQRHKIKLHAEIDEMFANLMQAFEAGVRKSNYELPLTTTPAHFKGLRPSAIIFENGEKVRVRTWRETVETLLKRCDESNHEDLVKISDDIQGRNRSIMSTKESDLQSPMEIGKGLYMESYYDTETFMRILTKRIFDGIGYDYSGIKIRVS